jgi:hypothetical protein
VLWASNARPLRSRPGAPLHDTPLVIRKLLPAVLALAAALTMPQAASAQAVADERAAAREFAYAAYRLRVRIKHDEPAMRRAVAFLDSRACRDALGGDERDVDQLPRLVQRGLAVVILEVELGAMYGVVHGHFSTFVAELDRVATADPALVAGRDSWRSSVELISQLRPLPRDTCSRIRRWRLDGYPFDRVPALQPGPLHGMFVQGVSQPARDDLPESYRALQRAGDRMVELGVTEGQARRFTGSTLLNGIELGLVMLESSNEAV